MDLHEILLSIKSLKNIFNDVIRYHKERKNGFGYPQRIMFIDIDDGFISNFHYDGFRPQIGEVWKIPMSSHNYDMNNRMYVKIVDVVYELVDCGDIKVFCRKVKYTHDGINE